MITSSSALSTTSCRKLVLLACLMSFLLATTVMGEEEEEPTAHNETETEEEHYEVEPAYAVLYPWFILAMGVVSYYTLSRYAPWMPYTAIMFCMGTVIGVATRTSYGVGDESESPNQLNISIEYFWMEIDSEVLLLTFLPGLVFSDSTSLNTHLFEKAFGQILLMAFPLVLAGTALSALVAYYIFPYGWSFNLAMTFGSILSATDPAAVAALLDQVGAPPRLKTHIAGESLLNDGSAIVFFTIFSQMYLLELGVPGLGEDIDWAAGISLFCRMAIGGMCIGMFFALLLIGILHALTWRLNREENVTEVAATITMAYLTYYTADSAWGTSGVIAVVTLGVITQAFGRGSINDGKLYEDFWSMVEWFLNTVLFSLGGLVWGAIVANNDPDYPELVFTARDWGYIFVNYILLTVIRFGLFTIAYPITANIGLKSSPQECFFQAYGGLRGAVGIALAIFLENLVRNQTLEGAVIDTKYIEQVRMLFGHVGGIAFLTLMINGVTAGPVLRKLGLADVTDIRKRMLRCYEGHFREHAIEDFVRMIAHDRFMWVKVNFGIIQHHLPQYFSNLTRKEFMETVEKHARLNPDDSKNVHAQLKNILPYLKKDDDDDEQVIGDLEGTDDNDGEVIGARRLSVARKLKRSTGRLRVNMFVEDLTLVEFRRIFLEIVRSRYADQLKLGEVLEREFVTFSLTQSLDIAAEHADKGPLNDWDFVGIVQQPWVEWAKAAKRRLQRLACFKCTIHETIDPEAFLKRLNIEQCVFFIGAHMDAQGLVKEQFDEDQDYAEVAKQVLQESSSEVDKAIAKLESFDIRDVELILSHKIIRVLLNNTVSYVEELAESGLLKEQEATRYLEEIQETWNKMEICDLDNHPGEMPSEANETSGGDLTKSKSIGTGTGPDMNIEVSRE